MAVSKANYIVLETVSGRYFRISAATIQELLGNKHVVDGVDMFAVRNNGNKVALPMIRSGNVSETEYVGALKFGVKAVDSDYENMMEDINDAAILISGSRFNFQIYHPYRLVYLEGGIPARTIAVPYNVKNGEITFAAVSGNRQEIQSLTVRCKDLLRIEDYTNVSKIAEDLLDAAHNFDREDDLHSRLDTCVDIETALNKKMAVDYATSGEVEPLDFCRKLEQVLGKKWPGAKLVPNLEAGTVRIDWQYALGKLATPTMLAFLRNGLNGLEVCDTKAATEFAQLYIEDKMPKLFKQNFAGIVFSCKADANSVEATASLTIQNVEFTISGLTKLSAQLAAASRR